MAYHSVEMARTVNVKIEGLDKIIELLSPQVVDTREEVKPPFNPAFPCETWRNPGGGHTFCAKCSRYPLEHRYPTPVGEMLWKGYLIGVSQASQKLSSELEKAAQRRLLVAITQNYGWQSEDTKWLDRIEKGI